ncbi:MAG: 50S ribosomal protein L11 methyltransferase [Dissulfurispiraceae bacterium]|jgi:ribosomal protein L11 methyltransferase|nr:50S ribosomal protein L11 methyltransferase [Dissulfurispiraceae bacterium]
MKYLNIKIKSSENAREPLTALLHDLGMKGIHEDSMINAYFDEDIDSRLICARIKELESFLKFDDPDTFMDTEVCFLPDTDWNEEWKKSFFPINIGKKLVITPPWLKRDQGNRIEVIVDPAMAFGTGHHETTARCLQLIENLSECLQMSSFLDLGTGTGILSIAASKLGCKRVVAVDNDTAAIEAAEKNIANNKLDNIALITGTIDNTSGEFELIAANIISETLILMAEKIIQRLSPGGSLILSGMISGQEDDVLTKYINSALKLSEIFYDGKWATLLMRKTSPK